MIQPAKKGTQFEYITGVRDAAADDMSFDGAAGVLDAWILAK